MKERIPSIPESPSPETAAMPAPELSPERREIFERGQEARRGLLEEIFKSRTRDLAGNLLPGVDVAKMITEATRGRTFGGHELSGRERFAYALTAGTIAASYALLLSGHHKEGMHAREAAMALGTATLGPDLIKEAIQKAKTIRPELASFLEKCRGFIGDKRALAEEFGADVAERLKQIQISPDFEQ